MLANEVPQAVIDSPIREQYEGKFNRNTLPRKVESNSIGAVIFRADFELRWLRQAKKARCFWTLFLGASGLKKALKGLPADVQEVTAAVMQTVQAAQIASRELREWSEREADLLGIGRPARRQAKERKTQQMPVVELSHENTVSDVDTKV